MVDFACVAPHVSPLLAYNAEYFACLLTVAGATDRAMLFTVASVYTARCFGPTNVGRLHGMALSLAGIFSYGNYLIVSATNSQLEGDFTFYSWCSLLATVPLVPMVGWLDRSRLVPLADIARLAEGEREHSNRSSVVAEEIEQTQGIKRSNAP